MSKNVAVFNILGCTTRNDNSRRERPASRILSTQTKQSSIDRFASEDRMLLHFSVIHIFWLRHLIIWSRKAYVLIKIDKYDCSVREREADRNRITEAEGQKSPDKRTVSWNFGDLKSSLIRSSSIILRQKTGAGKALIFTLLFALCWCTFPWPYKRFYRICDQRQQRRRSLTHLPIFGRAIPKTCVSINCCPDRQPRPLACCD